MSDLQLGLLVLGALAVAGVLIFNKWQELRARRDGDKRFGSKHDDVLLEAGAAPPGGSVNAGAHTEEAVRETSLAPGRPGRIEPVWHESDATVWAEPGSDAPAMNADHQSARLPPPRADAAPAALDARIDCIAEIMVAEPLLGSHLILEAEKFSHRRNVAADGFHEGARVWEAIDRDAVYEKVRIGIQISDRSGPLRADELGAFQNSVNALAQLLGGRVEWPAAQDPLTRAAELDAFCAGVDVQVGINVMAPAPFADTKLRGLAEANGFAREDDGVFRRRDDDGTEWLKLQQASPAVVSFILDVPRVAREVAALALMTQCAKRFAAGIDGQLVDDQGKPLNDAGIAAIQSGLATIYGRMEAATMPAGGALARRVFS